MSVVIRNNFENLTQVKAYWEGVITESKMKPFPKTFTKFYKEHKTNTKDSKFSEVIGLGLMTQASEYGELAYDAPIAGYDKTITPVSYNQGIAISREAWDDDQQGELRKTANMCVRSYMQTQEILAHYQLNNGFATVKSPDASYLFSTSHPLEGGGTGSNRLSTDSDLTASSLQQAIAEMKNTTDGRGKNLLIMPKILLVPLGLEFTANEILKSELKAGTANNDMNVLKGLGIEVVASPFLTTADNWFLIGDPSDEIHPLKYVNRIDLETAIELDFDRSDSPKIRSYTRFAFDNIGWRNIFGVDGA